jgi:hypothetical protein
MGGENHVLNTTTGQIALLRSESAVEYEKCRREIYQELAPVSRIERDLADDVVAAMWDGRRLRGFSAAMINNAFIPALQILLLPTSVIVGIDTDALAEKWFEDKRPVLQKLATIGADEDSIEAEAFRLRLPECQAHAALLASAENRKRKALRAYEDYRAGCARPISARSVRGENRG